MADEGSTSLQRAIAILNVLGSDAATRDADIGVSQIARLLGREKSQVSRTLKALAAAGLVDRDPDTRGYRLGWRLFTLAAGAADRRLVATAPEVLRKLVARVGERAHLTVLEGGEVLTVLSESPARIVQAAGWVGRATPIHCTSSGRALLFDHDDEEVRALPRGATFGTGGPNVPRDVDELLLRLHEARRYGYVLADEEFEAGLVAAAAPVRGFRGQIIAAVNISAPKFRLGRGLNAAGRQVRAAADRLSRAMSAAPPTGEAVPGPVARTTDNRTTDNHATRSVS